MLEPPSLPTQWRVDEVQIDLWDAKLAERVLARGDRGLVRPGRLPPGWVARVELRRDEDLFSSYA